MRRWIGRAGLAGTAAAALVAATSGTASAGFVVNDSGTAVLVDASYVTADGYGFVSAWQPQGGEGWLFFSEDSGDWVQCTGAGTKKTGDDTWGFVGTFTYGEGPGTVSVSGRYASGSGSGTVTGFRDVVDDCAGTYVTEELGATAVSVSLAASGDVYTERGSGSFHLPGEFNERYAFTFTGRSGSGSVTVGGVASPADGGIGKTSWKYHANG